MKKITQSVMVSLMALTLLMAPVQSRAVVAIFNPGILMAGLISLGAGAGLGGIALLGFDNPNHQGGYDGDAYMLIGGVLGVVAGVIMLDSNQDIEFAPVTADQAAKIGLTPEEMNAYNDPSELDVINLVKQEVQEGLQGISDPKAAAQKSRDLWQELGTQNLSPDAFTALQKIALQR